MHRDSPEERLLKLIKRKGRKGSEIKEHRGANKPVEKEAVRSPQKESVLAEAMKNVFVRNKVVKVSFLKPVNRSLVIVSILLLLYFAYSIIFLTQTDLGVLVNEPVPAADDGDAGLEENGILQDIPDYTEYSRDIHGKQLFTRVYEDDKQKESTEPDIDVTKRFNLVGILVGDEPQAIIEDRETNKTHYVITGQSFNNIKVNEIGDGKVVLSYKDRETVLIL